MKEARKAAKDIGLECQECGKRFRSANPRYGITKCPKCKSTDLDLAYGEEVEIDEKFAGWIAMYGGKKLEIRPKKGEIDSLWDAKKSAIDHFKVPKSKQGLLAIKPAHEEVEEARSREDELK